MERAGKALSIKLALAGAWQTQACSLVLCLLIGDNMSYHSAYWRHVFLVGGPGTHSVHDSHPIPFEVQETPMKNDNRSSGLLLPSRPQRSNLL